MYKLDGLLKKKVADLKEIATKLNLKKFEKLNKTDLVYKILDEQATSLSKEEKSTSSIRVKRNRYEKTNSKVKENIETEKFSKDKNNDKEIAKSQNIEKTKNNSHPKKRDNDQISSNNHQSKKGLDYDYDFDGIISSKE